LIVVVVDTGSYSCQKILEIGKSYSVCDLSYFGRHARTHERLLGWDGFQIHSNLKGISLL